MFSDDKYSTVEGAGILTIDVQDHPRVFAGTPVGSPSVCQ